MMNESNPYETPQVDPNDARHWRIRNAPFGWFVIFGIAVGLAGAASVLFGLWVLKAWTLP